MRSADTHPEAERVQLQLFREATVAKRLALAFSLTRTTMRLAWRSVENDYPEAGDDELKVRFVDRVYGPELAEGLRRDLERRHQQQ